MIGQGRPIVWKLYGSARLAMRALSLPVRTLLLMVLLWSAVASTTLAEEVDVRLRFAWGSGDSAKHRWVGRIICANAQLSDCQPLGIEADAPAAVQLINNELIVDPWEPRGFDGCDVTIIGDGNSLVRFELRSEQSSTPTVVEVPLTKLAKEQVRESIDSLGSMLLAYRCPGDRFRLVSKHKNLIFDPGAVWSARFKTDFAAELATGPVSVELVLRALGSEAVLWQSTQVITAESPSPDQLVVDVACPNVEGAYRLSLSASAEQSFATRFVPGQGPKPFATREIDLVVIDPQAKLPPLVDRWVPLLSIDPANPGWWQRLPTWAQVSRLTGKPPGTLGNVRLLTRPGDANGLVELAPSANTDDPTWQSFALPIQEAGVPHLIEIAYPLAEKQQLGISIVEPDAAGRVTSAVIDSGLSVEEVIEGTPGQVGLHRLLFWPRTQSPQLLIVNRNATQPGVFGRITLSRQDTAASQAAVSTKAPDGRLVAGYIAKPVFAQNFGAAEVLDPASGMSVQSWSTFLDGAHRFAQHLKLAGFNGALVSVGADGSSLYPCEHLIPSPRYDTGLLAASGQDPVRKDVLEMLLRVCDRENIRMIPTLQLASPLPRLEARRRDTNLSTNVWFDSQGRELIHVRRTNLAANYNLLNPRVQEEITIIVSELIARCSEHSSFSGVALQLDSNGYGVLPGLEWGFDDETVASFSTDTGIAVLAAGDRRYAERAAILLEEHRAEWQAWRIKKVTDFYRKLAEQVASPGKDWRLILTTEELFAEPMLAQAVRRSVSQPGRLKELLAERGIDLDKLAAIPGVDVTNTQRLSPPGHLQERVTDLVVNEATQAGNLGAQSVTLAFSAVTKSRLASFDQSSPFGVDRTHLVLAHVQDSYAQSASKLLGAAGSYVEGGEYLSLAINADHAQQLLALARLPKDASETRVVSNQPIEIRIARTANEAYLICSNESPWSVSAKLDLEAPGDTTWKLLGGEDQQGRLGAGRSAWSLQLPAYGMQMWRFSSPQIRPGELHVAPNNAVREYLTAKIHEIESRTGNLNIERDYAQLQNPGFEHEGGETRIFGWQPRKGVDGSIEIDSSLVHGGQRSLRLKSVDQVGVAAQSHLFPLPETGMLVITAQVRAGESSEGAALTLAVETDEAGQSYRRARTIPLSEEFSSQWKQCEMVVSDLPVGDAEQLRVQFHVTGNADVAVDDVALCDLWFDDQRRSELVKRVFAAKTALDEEQYTDCLRLLNEYWPQYLVEYVPPVVGEPAVLAKQPANTATKAVEDSSKSGGRFRNMIPKIWR